MLSPASSLGVGLEDRHLISLVLPQCQSTLYVGVYLVTFQSRDSRPADGSSGSDPYVGLGVRSPMDLSGCSTDSVTLDLKSRSGLRRPA
jgi:hypothetical protein